MQILAPNLVPRSLIGEFFKCPVEDNALVFQERLLGTRFTNAISCFEPGPQEPYILWNIPTSPTTTTIINDVPIFSDPLFILLVDDYITRKCSSISGFTASKLRWHLVHWFCFRETGLIVGLNGILDVLVIAPTGSWISADTGMRNCRLLIWVTIRHSWMLECLCGLFFSWGDPVLFEVARSLVPLS
jgi:hypothetical protein